MPTLLLLRHAKSAWPPGVPDFDRPLNPRGRRDAPVAGRVLAARPAVDLALVSPAERAVQTFALAGAEFDPPGLVRQDRRIYDAVCEDLLDVLAEVPAEVGCVLLVGHNPGIEDLAIRLSRPDETPDMLAMTEKYPTSGLAHIEIGGSWGQPEQGELVSFAVPRG